MNFGQANLREMLFASVLAGALSHECISNQNNVRCAEGNNGELRGRLLNHVQENTHLGKYTTWIAEKVANALLVSWSYQNNLLMYNIGGFSQKMPVVGENGIYNMIDTKDWLAKEKPKAAATAISIHTWAKYQVPFQAAVAACVTTARLLEKINQKDCTTLSGKEEILGDIASVSNRSLATFKQELAKVEGLTLQGHMCIDVTPIIIGFQIDMMDFMVNTEKYLEPSIHVNHKVAKAVVQLKKIEAFLEQCMKGMTAKASV